MAEAEGFRYRGHRRIGGTGVDCYHFPTSEFLIHNGQFIDYDHDTESANTMLAGIKEISQNGLTKSTFKYDPLKLEDILCKLRESYELKRAAEGQIRTFMKPIRASLEQQVL